MTKTPSDRARKRAWDRLIAEANECDMCPLYSQRNRVVIYRGNPLDPTWCFLAEAPGEEEDMRGRVLVGKSGKLFNHYIEDSKIPKKDWCAINLLQCRPEKNKFPKPDIAAVCIQRYLWLKLDIIRPKILVIMGAQAAKTLLNAKKIGDVAGRFHDVNPTWNAPYLTAVAATYHPAYALRQQAVIGIMRSHIRYFNAYAKRQGWVKQSS